MYKQDINLIEMFNDQKVGGGVQTRTSELSFEAMSCGKRCVCGGGDVKHHFARICVQYVESLQASHENKNLCIPQAKRVTRRDSFLR